MTETILLNRHAHSVVFECPPGALRCRIPNDADAPKWARGREFKIAGVERDLDLRVFQVAK